MKKIFVLLLISFQTMAFGQSNEGAEVNSELTSVTYVELNNDIISSSNISLGYLG